MPLYHERGGDDDGRDGGGDDEIVCLAMTASEI